MISSAPGRASGSRICGGSRTRLFGEDAHAFGLRFRGGQGACVIDDYVTHVKSHHYREIACFAQGRSSAGVIIAAALAGDWTRFGPVLERAVDAWQVR